METVKCKSQNIKVYSFGKTSADETVVAAKMDKGVHFCS